MLQSIYRRLIIPTFESKVKRRRTFRYLNELERSQWELTATLRGRQVTALRQLLSHAVANAPYYRALQQEQSLPADEIEDADQLQRWPLLWRETIAQHQIELCAANCAGKLIAKSTGGSSGSPLQFYLDDDSNDRRMAAWHRGYSWAGAGLGTKQLYLWGVPLVPQTWRQRQKDQLYNRWLYRREMVNTFKLCDETVPQFESLLRRWRPDSIVAYTNSIFWMARAFEERGVRPTPPGSIVVGAEKLHDFQRATIERVFQAPVFETYGSREFMLIGGECDRHCGLHLTMENLIVEIVNDDGDPTPPGEEGNVVITDLFNYGMPFIRYVTGDRAIAGFQRCECGRGLPLLRQVVGRRLDVVVTAAGVRLPGEFFPHVIKDFPAVRQFQVVQSEDGAIDVKLVVGQRWSESARDELELRIRRAVGDATTLRVLSVDSIPLTRAGKLQVVVSRFVDATTMSAESPR